MVGGISTFDSASVVIHRPPSWRIAPWSISIWSICSRYSGFPSAATVTRSTIVASRSIAPSRFCITRALSSAPSGSTVSVLNRSRPSSHSGCSSSSSRRDEQSSSTGA